MKTTLSVIAFFVFVSIAGAQDDTVGRYQLVTGMFEPTIRPAVPAQHVIIRIDTKTGKAWKYVVFVDQGKLKEFWSEIAEPKEAESR